MKVFQILFLSSVLFFCSCQPKIHVQAEKYKWKSFDTTNDQTVDLSKYKSPNQRPGQESDRLVIVCASGGGARASAFTIGTLLELERIVLKPNESKIDKQVNIANEIDYFSTVSGGGWGAGAFIAYKYQNIQYLNKYKITNPFPTFNSFETYLAHWSDRRYARYQFYYFLGFRPRTSGDVIMDRLNSGYLGWVYRSNLEDSLWQLKNNNGKEHFDKNSVDEILLSDVFTSTTSIISPKLPMLIANTTNIDNYMLVPFTPDRLNLWGLKQYRYTTVSGAVSNPKKMNGVLPLDSLYDMPLAAGIKASSSVNSFIGASTFPAKRKGIDYYLHLEDGGVLDNLGLHTAKAILKQNNTITDKTKRIVIIIDASSSGVKTTKKIKKRNAGRIYSSARISPPAVPDIQYPLSRERLKALEDEYNCTVIYLGNEVLLDTTLGKLGSIPLDYSEKQKTSEKNFYEMYKKALKDSLYFNKNVSMQERSVLFRYIEKNLKTWFSASKSINGGLILVDPEDTKGYAKIMFLAGRGVVQLKRDEIIKAFGIK